MGESSKRAPYLTLYCSEVAACAGHHKFKQQHEAFEKVWARADPQGYHQARVRCGLEATATEEERAERLLEERPALRSELEQRAATVQASTTEQVQQIVTDVLSHVAPEDRKTLDQHVRSSLHTEYGTHAEDDVVDVMSSLGSPVVRDDALRKKVLGVVPGHDRPWSVAGRTDGFIRRLGQPDIVLEVKNRVRDLPPAVPLYELIQTQAYCQICDLPSAKLVEALRREDGTQLRITQVPRDDDFWQREVGVHLGVFMRALCDLLSDDARQDSFLKSKRRAQLMKSWSNAVQGAQNLST